MTRFVVAVARLSYQMSVYPRMSVYPGGGIPIERWSSLCFQ